MTPFPRNIINSNFSLFLRSNNEKKFFSATKTLFYFVSFTTFDTFICVPSFVSSRAAIPQIPAPGRQIRPCWRPPLWRCSPLILTATALIFNCYCLSAKTRSLAFFRILRLFFFDSRPFILLSFYVANLSSLYARIGNSSALLSTMKRETYNSTNLNLL